MENEDLSLFFNPLRDEVVRILLSSELINGFPDCLQVIKKDLDDSPATHFALPVLACQIAGGARGDGILISAGWYLLSLASEVLDAVEDREFEPEDFAHTPEIAANLGTALIFLAYSFFARISDGRRVAKVIEIFSSLGVDATIGQHQDLQKIQRSVEGTLVVYWETTILKAGSVFRMATAGGAAAGTAEEQVIEALGDFGSAFGVLLQLIDDCRDAFSTIDGEIKQEVSLPLLMYLMAGGEVNISLPAVTSRLQWNSVLKQAGVIDMLVSVLLEWEQRGRASLEPLRPSQEKQLLEKLTKFYLEKCAIKYQEV